MRSKELKFIKVSQNEESWNPETCAVGGRGRQLKTEVGRLKAYPKGGYFLAPTWVGGRLLSNKGDSSR